MKNSISTQTCSHNHSSEDFLNDPIYGSIAHRLHLISEVRPLFVTNAVISRTELIELLPTELKQTYNCTKCANFFRKFGSLAYMDDNGDLISALWSLDESIPTTNPHLKVALGEFAHRVQKSKIIRAFSPSMLNANGSNLLEGNTAGYDDRKFKHFHGRISDDYRARTYLEEYNEVKESLLRLKKRYGLKRAYDYVNEISIFSEPHKGISKSHKSRIMALKNILSVVRDLSGRIEVIVPTLYNICHENETLRNALFSLHHLGGSFLGAAIDELDKGWSVEKALREIVSRTAVENYKSKDISNVSMSQLSVAMKEFEQEGLMSALVRRMARPDDLPTYWKKSVALDTKEQKSQNPFEIAMKAVNGHKFGEQKPTVNTVKDMTVKTFLREVLPNALACQIKLGNYASLFRLNVPTTTSRPIFVWDNENERREYCTCVSNTDERVSKYGLNNSWNDVVKISPTPWTSEDCTHSNVSNLDPSMLFILQGEYNGGSEQNVSSYGTALKQSLFKHRAAIDSALANTRIEPVTDPAIGISFSLNTNKEILVRVEDKEAIRTYRLLGIE
ncbi:hypothetical protein [Vibrio sp. D431a]|uniref:hypothetical protein n=1 Tax=Vibrio sp. D431a TaxID=2837388 RepID=UPI002553C2B0|nr:hypothetical protein [Vibrio sp. D431a]MDK9790005.1 hypothetical protein [Vibrio sp. D431a]